MGSSLDQASVTRLSYVRKVVLQLTNASVFETLSLSLTQTPRAVSQMRENTVATAGKAARGTGAREGENSTRRACGDLTAAHCLLSSIIIRKDCG
jgi:hypothetical protein